MAKYRCTLTFAFDNEQTYLQDELVEAADEAEAKSIAEQRHLISHHEVGSMKQVAILQCQMTKCVEVGDS